jgi:hypothetical protein
MRPCRAVPRLGCVEVRPIVALVAASLTLAGCSRTPVEEGLFFPTWSAEGDVPAGQVFGRLVKDDRCLYVEANNQRTLVAWEDGMGFENGTLLDGSGAPIAQVGEVIHGGGGYYGDRGHIEDLSWEPIPERCVPGGENGDRYAIIYEVEAGPLE